MLNHFQTLIFLILNEKEDCSFNYMVLFSFNLPVKSFNDEYTLKVSCNYCVHISNYMLL